MRANPVGELKQGNRMSLYPFDCAECLSISSQYTMEIAEYSNELCGKGLDIDARNSI